MFVKSVKLLLAIKKDLCFNAKIINWWWVNYGHTYGVHMLTEIKEIFDWVQNFMVIVGR